MKTLLFSCLLTLLFFSTSLPAQEVDLLRREGNTTSLGMEVDGLDRQFILHLPSSYDPNADRAFPVVFMLHGGGGSGKKYYNISGWKELGEKEGIITVFPTAHRVCLDRQDGRSTDNYWLTVGKEQQLCAGQAYHSDANFLRAIVDYLKANYRVDAGRFYCTGFSNGMGFTLSRVIPELSDVFAAVGGTSSLLNEQISASTPIPCFMMVGERDPKLIRYNGNQPFPTTATGIEQNAFLTRVIGNVLTMLKLSADYQAVERKKHTTLTYAHTTDGGEQVLKFSVLKGQKHIYPRGIPEHNNIRAAEIFWDFFQQYQK